MFALSRCLLIPIAASLVLSFAWASDTADVGAHSPTQDAADLIRQAVGADGAFIAAVQVKPTFDKDDLSSLLRYPSEAVVVLNLTGAQIKKALEQSVSLFPQPNESFLQISGIEVTFSKTAPPNSRILTVMMGGVKLDGAKVYSIAMPSSLAHGTLGFYRIWDTTKIARTLQGKTIQDVLRGKHSVGSASRWSAQ